MDLKRCLLSYLLPLVLSSFEVQAVIDSTTKYPDRGLNKWSSIRTDVIEERNDDELTADEGMPDPSDDLNETFNIVVKTSTVNSSTKGGNTKSNIKKKTETTQNNTAICARLSREHKACEWESNVNICLRLSNHSLRAFKVHSKVTSKRVCAPMKHTLSLSVTSLSSNDCKSTEISTFSQIIFVFLILMDSVSLEIELANCSSILNATCWKDAIAELNSQTKCYMLAKCINYKHIWRIFSKPGLTTINVTEMHQKEKVMLTVEALQTWMNKFNATISTFQAKGKEKGDDFSVFLLDLIYDLNISGQIKQLTLFQNGIQTLRVGKNQFDHLTHLDLSQNEIDVIPFNFFSKFPKLKTLNLNYNRLSSLPKGLNQLKTLQKLYIGGNQPNEGRFHFNSSNSTPFPQLTLLSLSDTFLEYLDFKVFTLFPHLEELYLDKCHLKIIPSEFLNYFQTLVHLDLSANKLNAFDFYYDFKIQHLNLSGNDLIQFSISSANLSSEKPSCWDVDVLKQNKCHLNIMDLSYNQIGSWKSSVIPRNLNLCYLNLTNNKLDEINAQMLKDFKNVKDLRLKSNPYNCSSCTMVQNWTGNESGLHIFDETEMTCVFPVQRKGDRLVVVTKGIAADCVPDVQWEFVRLVTGATCLCFITLVLIIELFVCTYEKLLKEPKNKKNERASNSIPM